MKHVILEILEDSPVKIVGTGEIVTFCDTLLFDQRFSKRAMGSSERAVILFFLMLSYNP